MWVIDQDIDTLALLVRPPEDPVHSTLTEADKILADV
jgi:hypothetical protein